MRAIVNTVKELRGLVSEPVRSLVAKRLADMITDQIKAEDYAAWTQKGVPAFYAACGVTVPAATVPDDHSLEPTKLATIINTWAAMTEYKEGDEFKEFTQEMASLRNTILEDLRSGCQLGMGVVLVLTKEEAKRVALAVEGAWEPDELMRKILDKCKEKK